MRFAEHGDVRLPAVAGTFYKAEKAALDAQLERLLDEASRTRAARAARAFRLRPAPRAVCPKALIVPHAGYIYSGAIAATGYAELLPHASQISRVVLLGPAHRVPVDGAVAAGARWLRTPLGDLEVDADALESEVIAASPAVHAREHSLEVQLPFLQKVVPSARVVPLAVGRAPAAYVARVLSALWGGPETVVIVSSDLSHYLPYDIARELDIRTASRILELDPSLSGDEACGAAPINGLLVVAREKQLKGELLDLRSSGDTAGAHEEVVGYGAFALFTR